MNIQCRRNKLSKTKPAFQLTLKYLRLMPPLIAYTFYNTIDIHVEVMILAYSEEWAIKILSNIVINPPVYKLKK